jgi:hypothetical protein
MKEKMLEEYQQYPEKFIKHVKNYIQTERDLIISEAEKDLREFLQPIEIEQRDQIAIRKQREKEIREATAKEKAVREANLADAAKLKRAAEKLRGIQNQVV